mgnify:CR=1 FL=1
MIKQGTISVILGAHSPIHSLLVLLSWKRLYGKWPKFWQVVCIFLHDIGHWGKDYLDSYDQKFVHFIAGARLAFQLFGEKGCAFVLGHISQAYVRSELYKPDKYSWVLAPRWWLYWNTIVEPKLAMGYSRREAVRRFREQVRKSIESGEYRSTHSMFLERCQDAIE